MSVNTFLAPSPVIPPFLIITAITRSFPAIVTVSTANGYVPGQLVHFTVPPSYGMDQINELTGLILSVDNTNLIFSVDIDSTMFDPFVVPTGNVQQPASLSPAGTRNIYNFSYTPFHSEGNFGN